MNTNEFVSLVEGMRNAQRDYFAMRSHTLLMQAKILERKVDEAIEDMKRESREFTEEQLTFHFDS